jgi:hypothetical protein
LAGVHVKIMRDAKIHTQIVLRGITKMSEYIVTIRFSSDWSPHKWNLHEILDLQEGESAEIIKIEEIN